MSFLFAPLPHEEAAARIASLPILTRDVFDGLLPELKAHAFTITGLDRFDQLRRARDELAAVPRGDATWQQAKKRIAADLEERLSGKEAVRRAELLLRTHTFRGYAVARYRTLMQQTDVFPFWQYKTHGDDRVRRAHRDLNGKVFPAGHPIWQRIFPPWDWGCRCLVVPLRASDVSPDAMLSLQLAREQAVQDETLLQSQDYKPLVYSASESDHIAASGQLYLPSGQTVSLAPSPTWTASPWSEVGNLRHTWQLIQERYRNDPDTLRAFIDWSMKTEIEKGFTVAHWLDGKSLTTFHHPMLRNRHGRTVEISDDLMAALRRDMTTPHGSVGVIPDLRTDTTPKLEAAVRQFESQVASDDHENAAAWSREGTQRERRRGGVDRVSLHTANVTNGVTSHNHPGQGPPSAEDLTAVIQARPVEARIVTQDRVYRLRRGPQADLVPGGDVRRDPQFLDHIATADAMASMLADGMKWDQSAIDAQMDHGVALQFAYRGIVDYKWEPR